MWRRGRGRFVAALGQSHHRGMIFPATLTLHAGWRYDLTESYRSRHVIGGRIRNVAVWRRNRHNRRLSVDPADTTTWPVYFLPAL